MKSGFYSFGIEQSRDSVATMTGGYPATILQMWDHRIAMRVCILMQTTDIGLVY